MQKYCKISVRVFQASQIFKARFVNYDIKGFEYNPQITIDKNYTFFNPKPGISYNKNN